MTSRERIHLAQELHDGIAQDLVGVAYSLDLLIAATNTPAETRVELRTLRFRISALIEKVREEMFNLRSQDSVSLARKIRIVLSTLEGSLRVDEKIEEVDLPEESAQEVFRIATELIRNVVSHSQATILTVELSQNAQSVLLVISDDGIGGINHETYGYGITGVQERVKSIDGFLSWDSNESGTTIRISFPN
ncbi:MAG: hypothetical protein F2704_02070 [Actinobacteria bacterium]|uniref:histidine kinase n=1 Tax=freshwater metagenome TaxID=449393 RepID=A0A6J7CKR5_9ZZZZ|nr:hypothetical protein [Actinomycetota bacterium]MSX24401.1 hypothetical protein [Actinomycetota bacterium]MSY57039.1 hypothetical protein [Actinomycetota bacterium]MTB00085.1 hypothetical protein [Actinomycetota bacterium]